ncbi:hypothetical protein F7725_028644 [Dissostichus mawsoni]|uniref:Uncharacterized protein n=1 Tax=Dissostichus mawsoni TaxID=36200 RepID=A0A7J5XG86_DISMA|nr:hypothetical protein F7725_028644 [Dissostichus mawsoni]
MSISDAGELERRVVGGEIDTPQYRTARGTRTATASLLTCEFGSALRAVLLYREKLHQTSGINLQNSRMKHSSNRSIVIMKRQLDSSVTKQPSDRKKHYSTDIKAERLKEEEAAHCAESKVQSQKPIEHQFTSCLQFRLSRNPELNHSQELAPCLHSLTETQRTETKNSNHLIDGTTSPPDSSIKVACESPLSERISFPAKKREEAISVVCNELEATKDFSITQSSPIGSLDLMGVMAYTFHVGHSQGLTLYHLS